MDKNDIAFVIHEAVKALFDRIKEPPLPMYENSPLHQVVTMQAVDALIGDPSMTPDKYHLIWCFNRLYDGWIYSPVKDIERKHHNHILPWAMLTMEQRSISGIIVSAGMSMIVDAGMCRKAKRHHGDIIGATIGQVVQL